MKDTARTANGRNEFHEQAVFFAARIWENSLSAGEALNDISNYLNEQGQFSQSILCAMRALEIFSEAPNTRTLEKINCLILVGMNYIRFDQHKLSFYYLKMTIDEFSVQNQTPTYCGERVKAYNTAANALLGVGDYNMALNFGLQALKILGSIR